MASRLHYSGEESEGSDKTKNKKLLEKKDSSFLHPSHCYLYLKIKVSTYLLVYSPFQWYCIIVYITLDSSVDLSAFKAKACHSLHLGFGDKSPRGFEKVSPQAKSNKFTEVIH